MEKAIFVSKLKNLSFVNGEYNRLYFGQEFCDRLLPGKADLLKALDFAKERNLSFTLVTPFLTESHFQNWLELVEAAEEKTKDFEIVINDFGFLRALRAKQSTHPYLLGRLLCKQKRGPQLLRVLDKVPPSMLDHFRRSTSDVPITIQFLRRLGIERIELDNLLQGIERDNELPGSLYYPYGYITTTRLCLTNSCTKRSESLRAIFSCGRDCQTYSFRLTHKDMPIPVFLSGNTQFYHHDRLPDNLEELNVNRLVYEPEIPI